MQRAQKEIAKLHKEMEKIKKTTEISAKKYKDTIHKQSQQIQMNAVNTSAQVGPGGVPQ